MSAEPFIPPKTAARIGAPAVKGTRHAEALAIAFSLIGQQLSPNAVFQQLRDKYPADVTDQELTSIVEFAVSKNPKPIGTTNFTPQPRWTPRAGNTQPQPAKRSPTDQVRWWLGGLEITEEKFISTSSIVPPTDLLESASLVFELLYQPHEFINVVCDYTLAGDSKANPKGGGKTLSARDWCAWMRMNDDVPASKAGAWIRPNPGLQSGTGKDGAYCDKDITSHRFLLIESDVLPMDLQLAFYSKMKLPIALVVFSGAKSVHAWVWISASNDEEYRAKVARILTALAPFGFDESNKNPSRLSRLAGALREIGSAAGKAVQKLLFLNPKSVCLTDKLIELFEESLLVPVLSEKPLQSLFRDAVGRYEELFANQGKLGVPTGIKQFDFDTGGLKDGHFVVIAADTGGGKSTLALNWINHALHRGIGVALFSIEMDREEICDNLVSMNLSIDRNKFNTGRFDEADFSGMSGMAHLSTLPLWIFDDAIQTADTIGKAITQLKNENRIGLAIVDYVQLVTPANTGDIREQQVAGIANGLRAIAKDTRVPIVALSQLNEEGKIRESRVIAHAANIMILLESLRGDDGPPVMKVVKGRRIRLASYELLFESAYCRLKSPPIVSQEDAPERTIKPSRQYQPHND